MEPKGNLDVALEEDVVMTPRSSANYDELNGMTLTPHQHHDLEKIGTTKTERYDAEHGGLHPIAPQETNVTIASIVQVPDDAFYAGIPDGGYGWVVSFVGFLLNFIMFGVASIWGVFSNAYATTVLKDKATTIELMGVGSVLVICLNVFSPASPVLAARFGVRVTMAIGTVILSLGLCLAGFSTEIWHLYLTQGVLFGVGSSLTYMSVISVIPQWFTTRRGTAMGISSAGSGIGGLALSPMVSHLIGQYGIAWTYRIVGLMAFGICMVGSLLIRTRLPPNASGRQPIRSPIQPAMLKNLDFVILLHGLVISLTGYLIPLFYLPKYAATYGISRADSSNIVGVACALNAIGRLVIGYFADRIGRLNAYIISCVCAGIFCMAFWPFATTFGSLMAFAVLFGFFCGIYYALAPPITAAIVGTDNISSGLSILFLASAIAGTGPPIASAIQEATPEHGYIGVQMFSGSVYLFGALICLILKWKKTHSFFSVL
ncbi:major facilitator superfamily domain-containing protein [Choanephora cucurbitarum]|nr:major facilitator superfamily domain-containing protein [Choanephora cucurbitarum]